jgi:hypothetical protein
MVQRLEHDCLTYSNGEECYVIQIMLLSMVRLMCSVQDSVVNEGEGRQRVG